MNILLPKKSEVEQPFAPNDEVLFRLQSDPSIPQFGNFNLYNPAPNVGINQNIGAQIYQPRPYATVAGDNAGQNAEILVRNNKESSEWLNRKWRPAMGWMYMVVCIFDFIVFPIMFAIIQVYTNNTVNDLYRPYQQPAQWQPVTLMGAGLFHMAMGAVLGIAAYGRTKEKIEGVIKN